jgi:hypothetical protein
MVIRTIMSRRRTDKESKKQQCETCGNDVESILSFKKCPDCSSLRIATLAETGEKYCKACGLVLL